MGDKALKEEKKALKEAEKERKALEKKEKREVDEAIKLQKNNEKYIRDDEKEFNHEIKINSDEYKRKKALNEPPHLSVIEEVGNAVSHGLGAILALVGLGFMLAKATTAPMIVSAIIYGLSMFILMLNSCLYHSWKKGSTVKRVWRRFDYSSIYLLIGGTFTPLLLCNFCLYGDVENIIGYVWFGLMWAIIITGITLTCVFGPGRVKKVNFPLYFTIGWVGLAFIPLWFIHGRFDLFWWILAGGVVYTLGMIPFAALKGKPSAHFIWHLVVLISAVVHFLGIYFCIFC